MIYHVTPAYEWNGQQESDYFTPAAFALEGFIHCCTHEQLTGVLDRYYKGQTNLLLLKIDEQALEFQLKFEKSTNDELFPHLYGAINMDAIVSVEEIA